MITTFATRQARRSGGRCLLETIPRSGTLAANNRMKRIDRMNLLINQPVPRFEKLERENNRWVPIGAVDVADLLRQLTINNPGTKMTMNYRAQLNLGRWVIGPEFTIRQRNPWKRVDLKLAKILEERTPQEQRLLGRLGYIPKS